MTKVVPVACVLAFGVVGACSDRQNVQCKEDENCNLHGAGMCVASSGGGTWCAYPDSACPAGYRYSDVDVGDGVSGRCVDENSTGRDASVDGKPGDSTTDGPQTDASAGLPTCDSLGCGTGGASCNPYPTNCTCTVQGTPTQCTPLPTCSSLGCTTLNTFCNGTPYDCVCSPTPGNEVHCRNF